MKTEIIKTLHVESYTCETCNKASRSKQIIECCEKKHTCKHEEVRYYLTDYDDEIEMASGVCRMCLNCQAVLEQVYFDYDLNDQTILKGLFDVLTNPQPNENN